MKKRESNSDASVPTSQGGFRNLHGNGGVGETTTPITNEGQGAINKGKKKRKKVTGKKGTKGRNERKLGFSTIGGGIFLNQKKERNKKKVQSAMKARRKTPKRKSKGGNGTTNLCLKRILHYNWYGERGNSREKGPETGSFNPRKNAPSKGSPRR